MYIQKNEKIEKISWISVFFPEMGRAAKITAQLACHLIPPGLLTGPPQSPVAPSSHTLSLRDGVQSRQIDNSAGRKQMLHACLMSGVEALI